jgi:hypothetical protein
MGLPLSVATALVSPVSFWTRAVSISALITKAAAKFARRRVRIGHQ